MIYSPSQSAKGSRKEAFHFKYHQHKKQTVALAQIADLSRASSTQRSRFSNDAQKTSMPALVLPSESERAERSPQVDAHQTPVGLPVEKGEQAN